VDVAAGRARAAAAHWLGGQACWERWPGRALDVQRLDSAAARVGGVVCVSPCASC